MKKLLTACAVSMLAAIPTSAHAAVDDTTLVSRTDGLPGQAADGSTLPQPAVSGDGRFVAFISDADNLSSVDDDSLQNLFIRDTVLGTTKLVSRATGADGAAANADSFRPSITSDGRYVAFASAATNLSGEDVRSTLDVFVRDTGLDTTTLVSRATGPAGQPGAADSFHPSISGSGMQIAFHSAANNLSDEDADGTIDVLVRDLSAATTTLASRATGTAGAAGDGDSVRPSISANGQRVAFESEADNLSNVDNDAVRNIFVREARLKSTYPISRTTSTGFLSVGADGDSTDPALSADGSVVVFTSRARNLSDANAAGAVTQIFKRKVAEEETSLISRAGASDGQPAEGTSNRGRVSADGRYVAFTSTADNLSDQDGPYVDVFARDTVDNRIALVSKATGPNGAAAAGSSSGHVISGSGLIVVFRSNADNLSADDNDAFVNLYARELAPGLPPPVIVPDLGSNDHGHHGGTTTTHAGGDHAAAGHSPSHAGTPGHSGHTPSNVRLRGGILFASRSQDVDGLFVFVTIHEPGRIVLEGRVSLPGKGRSYRFKPVKRRLEPHILRRMRLKLSRRSLRAVKRTLERRRLRARVKLTAVGDSGKRQVVRRTIRLRP